jgi:predicted ATP-dependent serine protease
MGKIVKYCAACDESFAEKFGFCPNCGQAMTAFEMNPINGEPKLTNEVERSVENKEMLGTDEIFRALRRNTIFSIISCRSILTNAGANSLPKN